MWIDWPMATSKHLTSWRGGGVGMIGPWLHHHILHPGGVGGVGGDLMEGSVLATSSHLTSWSAPKLTVCLLVPAGARDALERSSEFLTLIQCTSDQNCKCTSDCSPPCEYVRRNVGHT